MLTLISSSPTILFLFNDLNAVSKSSIVNSWNHKSFPDRIKQSFKLLAVFVILLLSLFLSFLAFLWKDYNLNFFVFDISLIICQVRLVLFWLSTNKDE